MENSHSSFRSPAELLASESRFVQEVASSSRNDRSFAHPVNQHSEAEAGELSSAVSSTENQYSEYVCRDAPQTSAASFPSRARSRSLELPTAASSTSGYAPPLVSETTYSDRFIPIRSSSDFGSFELIQSLPSGSGGHSTVAPVGVETRDDSAAAYSNLLRTEILGSETNSSNPSSSFSTNSPPPNRLFRYKNEKLASSSSSLAHADSPFSLSPIGIDSVLCNYSTKIRRQTRKIARSPFKVLDAPSLQDDFYLNLVDWSNKNILAVGLGTCVYLWNASDSKVTKLCDLSPNDSICSVGWSQHGTYLAVGTNEGDIQIWDVNKLKKLREMKGHTSRVGALSWSSNILSTGSRDRNIFHRDVRSALNFDSRLTGHKSEICGLKWSFDGKELASGGNDNQLLLWNLHSTQPLHKFESHNAAVKAIAWSPHQHNLLVSGAGTADRCIRFWNTTTLSLITRVDTGSQVCNLAWSKNVNEIVSTHGYSQNQIVVWRYPLMSKLATLTGHSMRVLYLAVSPDGQTIVTGAGDETLRFWNVFPSQKSENSEQEYGIFKSYRTQIR